MGLLARDKPEKQKDQTMNAKALPEFARLEHRVSALQRKSRRAIKDTPEARKIDRKFATVERDFALGKTSKSVAALLKKLLRQRRQLLVLRWMYAFLRGELPQPAK
jgi:hypothetical protein